MNKENVKTLIEAGKAVVGIELGSTRIKAVMIDENHQPVATGSYDWENRLDGQYLDIRSGRHLERTESQLC